MINIKLIKILKLFTLYSYWIINQFVKYGLLNFGVVFCLNKKILHYKKSEAVFCVGLVLKKLSPTIHFFILFHLVKV